MLQMVDLQWMNLQRTDAKTGRCYNGRMLRRAFTTDGFTSDGYLPYVGAVQAKGELDLQGQGSCPVVGFHRVEAPHVDRHFFLLLLRQLLVKRH
jgi:hypothetical protein